MSNSKQPAQLSASLSISQQTRLLLLDSRRMTSSTESSALFTPLQVGRVTLSHRIVLTPLSRSRANKDHVHTDLGVEYYAQRSSVPGSLLITEGTVIHPMAGTWFHAPYIYTDSQVQAWKKVRIVHTHQ